MANPKVQKIQKKVVDFFTNHGEKVAAGFGGLIFVIGAASAITKPTISITPDQIASNAESAQKNLNQPQDEASILEALANDGVKELNFADTVAKTESEKIDVSELRVKHKWITLEPGAGLIRDQPVLIAINDVLAVAGRGGTTLFDLDDKGNRVPDDGTDSKEEEKSSGGKRGRGGRGGMGMGMGMDGSAQAKQSQREKQEEEAKFKKDQQALAKSLAGTVDAAKEEAKKKAREEAKKKESEEAAAATGAEMATTGTEQGGPFKEKLKPIRWAAVTGVIDHKALKDNYAKALRQDPKAANPNYHRIELERQTLQSDGSWGKWESVDVNKNNTVLDNLTEVDEELVGQENILSSIVDPLPFLVNGAFGGVHVASLVPKEKRKIEKPDPKTQGGMMGMMGGGRGGRGGMGSGMPGAGMGMMGGGGKGGMGGMMSGGGDDYAGFMFGGGTGSADEGDYPKTDAEEVMVRAFDFTVDADNTYKYRARIVVNNPNYKRDDINPGVDIESQYLVGPWSQITNAVYVPSDVAPYAIAKTPATNQNPNSNQVTFQVSSFNPEDGITVVRQFIAGPGMIIGEPTSTQIPASDGSGAKPKTVDFTSRQIVLGTVGGIESLAPLGGNGSITMPAMAFVMKPDGSIVIRNEAKDAHDPDLKFVQDVYAEELKKSDTKRKKGDMNSMGMGMGGMGGMSGGMSR